jgi:PST family polysaccharide transporter
MTADQGREPLLKFRAVSGVRWGSLTHGARAVVHLFATLAFARLLAPSDFGLVGMAMVAVGFVTLFKDLGTGAALIQKPRLDEETLSSVFWANILLGCLGAAALVLLAPGVAAFYAEPRLTPILRVLALSLVFSGPGVVPMSLIQKELRFPLLARTEMIALSGGAAAGVAAALAGAGVWSLVLHTLAVELLTSLLALRVSGFRPRAVLRMGSLRPLAGFSLNLSGGQFLGWLVRNVDQLLIGRFLGATQLGYYTLAVRLVLQPLRGALGVLGRVMFPVLSRIQDD